MCINSLPNTLTIRTFVVRGATRGPGMGDALAFHRAAFEALYDADALAVFARGLGAYTLLRKLIAVHCEPAALTFVLNIDPEARSPSLVHSPPRPPRRAASEPQRRSRRS